MSEGKIIEQLLLRIKELEAALLFYGTRQHITHSWVEDGDIAREALERSADE